MKIKSPITIEKVQFYTYQSDEEADCTYRIDQFPYDDRRDFAVDEDLMGVAVRLLISNERYDRGVRRNVKLTVTDLTMRCETASRNVKVNIRKDMIVKDVFVDIPVESVRFIAGHSYKLTVCDATSSEMLTEVVFHLFDQKVLGCPIKWYEIISGGIKPAWESGTYKVLNTVDCHDYYIRFTLLAKIEPMQQAVLPELEMRLYYPDGKHIEAQFNEPKYFGHENFKEGILTADFPFATCNEFNGIFYAELLCMEWPIAGFVFDTKRKEVEGSWIGSQIEPLEEYTPEAAVERLNEFIPSEPEQEDRWSDKVFDDMLDQFIDSQMSETEDKPDIDGEEVAADSAEETVEHGQCLSPLDMLDHLTGLSDIKKKLITYEHLMNFNKMRHDKGLPTPETSLHSMFLGSPGTGKTTVAKLMGEMLRRTGILSKGHVVVRERATLLGQFYHSEAEKTLAAIEEAQGGILFIDEAYQLYQPNDPKDPGKFVIETLLTALADESNRDWMLILAGYPDEMKKMFDMNPGFKSRIPDSNIYTFDDFTEGELMEIAENYFSRNNYVLTSDAQKALTTRLGADYARRGKNFGNARYVMNMIQTEILPSMAVRVMSEGIKDETSLIEIQAADIPEPAPTPKLTNLRPRLGFAI